MVHEEPWTFPLVSKRIYVYIFIFLVSRTHFFLLNYILLIMLLQLSQFFPCCPPHIAPSTPQAIPTPLFMSMGHAYKFFGYSISYTVLYIPHGYSVSTNLYFLIPSPLHPFPQTPLPFGNHPNILHIRDSVSVLFCVVRFLDSVVDRYMFIAILMCIVLIFFFFLNKSI